jgi:hypothetical protein
MSRWVIVLAIMIVGCAKSTHAHATKETISAKATPDAAPWKPDQSCKSDDECVPAPDCCPVPCTSYVINQKDLQRYEQQMNCPKDRTDCPQAGDCPTNAYLCVRGSCEDVFEGDADYRARQP